jgi:hypothetical protein
LEKENQLKRKFTDPIPYDYKENACQDKSLTSKYSSTIKDLENENNEDKILKNSKLF